MTTVSIPFGGYASILGTVIDESVNRFVGIPYALPPVDENRWRKPRKLPPYFFRNLNNKPYDATKFKEVCLQPPTPFLETGQDIEV